MKKAKTIIIAVVALIAVVLAVFAGAKIFGKSKEEADVAFLKAVLTKESELTTAKLKMTGVQKYEEGSNFLNRKRFTMVYTATIRAGIDIEKVDITADDLSKTIYIKIPKASVLDVKIDPSSIETYDEKKGLFKLGDDDAVLKAQSQAEIEAEIEASQSGILELADTQSETLIKGILANAIPEGYTIEVKP